MSRLFKTADFEAKAVLEERALERHAAEQAEYEAKMQERAEKQERTGKKPCGKPPRLLAQPGLPAFLW